MKRRETKRIFSLKEKRNKSWNVKTKVETNFVTRMKETNKCTKRKKMRKMQTKERMNEGREGANGWKEGRNTNKKREELGNVGGKVAWKTARYERKSVSGNEECTDRCGSSSLRHFTLQLLRNLQCEQVTAAIGTMGDPPREVVPPTRTCVEQIN